MIVRHIVVCSAMLSNIVSVVEASGVLRPCVHLVDRPEIYAVSNGYASFIFLDNAYSVHDRNQMRSAFMSQGVFTGIPPLIVRRALDVVDRALPAHIWHWGDGYSMWVSEEFVCTSTKPPVYDLIMNSYRDPFF